MKRIVSIFVALAGSFGITSLHAGTSLSSSYSDQGLNLNYSTSVQSGMTFFNAYLSIDKQVLDASVSITHDTATSDNPFPTEGWVSYNVSGLLQDARQEAGNNNQSSSIARNGVAFYSDVYTTTYQTFQGVWDDNGNWLRDIPGPWLETASLSAEALTGVTVLSAYHSYSEFTPDYGYGEKGLSFAAVTLPQNPTNWNDSVSWRVRFDSPVPTPEPASLGFLGVSAGALLLRRRKV